MKLDDLGASYSAGEFLAQHPGSGPAIVTAIPLIAHASEPPTGSGSPKALEAEHGITALLLDAGDDPRTAVRRLLEGDRPSEALAKLKVETPENFELLLLKLRERGVTSADVAALRRSLKAAERRVKTRASRAKIHPVGVGVAIITILPGAPVGPEISAPAGWRVREDGILREVADKSGGKESVWEQVSTAPMLIVGRLVDDNGGEKTRVAFKRDHGWKSRVVERRTLAAGRDIVDLASVGAPVNSNNAAALVEFFSAFEAHNLDHLPSETTTSKLGWQSDDQFLLGETLIGCESPTSPVTFVGSDAGDEQLAKKYQAAGDLASWTDAVTKVSTFPRVVVSVYAALAAVILRVLSARNFTVEWVGETSHGKTTALALGASVFGSPDQDDPAGPSIVGTWDSTRVHVERSASTLYGLPLFLDDTKRARSHADVVQAVYDIASGQGRARGTIRGTAPVTSFRTVLLMTGEESALTFAEAGGLRGRVVSLWGSPFGEASDLTRGIVSELWNSMRANHGVAGPVFVQFVVSNRQRWPQWHAHYATLRASYEAKTSGGPIMGRLAGYVAAIHVAAELAHEVFGFSWSCEQAMSQVWQSLRTAELDADRPAAALRVAVNWASTNQQGFWGRQCGQRDGYRVPPGGWCGQWEKPSWTFIAFEPERLKALLVAAGFDPNATIRTWHDRGWLKVNPRRQQLRVRIDGEPVWTVAVLRSAIESEQLPTDNDHV